MVTEPEDNVPGEYELGKTQDTTGICSSCGLWLKDGGTECAVCERLRKRKLQKSQ